MKYFIEDENRNLSIDSENPKEINLQDSLKLIEGFSKPKDEFLNNFIGFENEKGECIQFLKLENCWMIDIPFNSGEDIKQAEITINQVNEAIKDFFDGKSDEQIGEAYNVESID